MAIALLATAPAVTVAATPRCDSYPDAAGAVSRLRNNMARGRFVAYEPTSIDISSGHVTAANAISIRADLTVLRQRFDGLITYGALHGAESIPPQAAALHFRSLIIGVWNPFDEQEIGAALRAARDFPNLVVGLSLGNEVLFRKEHSRAALAELIRHVRRQAPHLALSTTEPFHLFDGPAADSLLPELDFLLVNVHPVFQPWFHVAKVDQKADFVVNVVTRLASVYCGPILVKETGEPTEPEKDGYSEERQATFYGTLARKLPPSRDRAFAYFAAFDAPWRRNDAGGGEAEAHWGLYDSQRRPKLEATQLSTLHQ